MSRRREEITKAEFDVVRVVMDRQPVAVREVQEALQPTLGLARTTVLTHLERLRKKQVLIREEVAGVNRYSIANTNEALMGGVVSNFVDQALGGQLTPLISYLSGNAHLTDDERRLLERMADRLSGEEPKP